MFTGKFELKEVGGELLSFWGSKFKQRECLGRKFTEKWSERVTTFKYKTKRHF